MRLFFIFLLSFCNYLFSYEVDDSINIMYVGTEETAPFMATSIISITDTANAWDKIRIFVLDCNMSDLSKARMLRLRELRRFSLEFIPYKGKKLAHPEKQYSLEIERLKFNIPESLRKLGRILVLDAHTIAKWPISQLFDSPLRNRAIGGVLTTKPDKEKKFSKPTYLLTTGVLLIDCGFFKLKETLDVINKYLDKVDPKELDGHFRIEMFEILDYATPVPIRFCVPPEAVFATKEERLEMYSYYISDDVESFIDFPTILYFPYHSYLFLDNKQNGDVFIMYLKKTPWKKEFNKIIMDKHKHNLQGFINSHVL